MTVKILLIAPLTLLHGQGIISVQVYEILKLNNNIEVVNTHSKTNKKLIKVLNGIYILYKIVYKIFLNLFRNEILYIYFSPSRTFLGSNRDFILLLLVKLSLILKVKHNIIVYAHLHGSDLNEFLAYSLYGKILKNLYIKCNTKVIILSKVHKEFALGKNYNNYFILKNKVLFNDNDYKLLDKKKLYISGIINVCFISNPIKEKGLKESIKWCQTNLSNYKWKMFIIGWTYDDYQEINGKLDDKTNLKFLGNLDNKEKVKILKKSHLFVFLSQKEAQPLVVIEAIIFKCIIVLKNKGMLRFFKSYDTVKFQTNDNINLVSKQIIKLLKSHDRIEKNSKNAQKQFNKMKFKKSIRKLFN